MIGVIVLIFSVAFVVYAVVMYFYWKRKLDEKAHALKETEMQVIHMEKMASLGTLAAGIAHEINNPLGFLISNLEFLRDYLESLPVSSSPESPKIATEELKAVFVESLEGAQRIKKVVSNLRLFSRRVEAQVTLIDVNQMIESVLSIVWNEIKYKTTVVKDYKAIGTISGDFNQLSQVLLNIIINASQALSDKGTITVATYEDAKNLFIKISDTGCGIPDNIKLKIFDPFFSTKQSTGLGLAISYNIVKKHGGDIIVDSKVGVGSTFVIQLPKREKGGGK
ncbi:MAG: ATP-binding protein [Candidatus Omnitrophica bacterium]|nr:ATP-binding protein [Candidatus Omnitrophota bacterium]